MNQNEIREQIVLLENKLRFTRNAKKSSTALYGHTHIMQNLNLQEMRLDELEGALLLLQEEGRARE